ncbi:MAG: recombinase family protein [Deltaproteobacteria bacterium]|nr:MAG: recombinase family protein [Deltaproteobacteria bacterium]
MDAGHRPPRTGPRSGSLRYACRPSPESWLVARSSLPDKARSPLQGTMPDALPVSPFHPRPRAVCGAGASTSPSWARTALRAQVPWPQMNDSGTTGELNKQEAFMPAVRVGIYTRVSTDLQAHQDEGSLDTQEARLRAALLARAGDHEVVRVFREEGQSGKSLDRPALQQMLDAVRRRELDLIIVTRIDRLSRSLLDFYEVHRLFEEHEVRFVSLNETFDTSSAVGRAMLKLVLVFAELEREQTAERTRLAMRARAERGLWNGGRPPLGYDGESGGHLAVNSEEAKVVRLIFAKYPEIRSTPKLAKWLNESGYRQKRYVSRRRGQTGGKPFTSAAVLGILKNRVYLGEVSHHGDRFEGQHEAIVAPDAFAQAATIIEANTRNRGKAPARTNYDYLLTGLVRCTCGSSLTTSAGKSRNGTVYHYYRCVGMNKKLDHVCPVKMVNAENLERRVVRIVREAARSPQIVEAALAEANAMANTRLAPVQEQVDQLKRDLQRASDEAEQLLSLILTQGLGQSATAKRKLEEAERRHSQLRTTLGTAEGELIRLQSQQLDMPVVVEALQGFDAVFNILSVDEKRDLLNLLVQQITVFEDRVEVRLHEGHAATAYLVENETVNQAAEHETPGVDPGFVTVSKWLPSPKPGQTSPSPG